MGKKTLGQKIKKARLDLKLTQQDLAGDFITRNMLSKIESDIATPSLKTLQYLTKRLNKPISYFLDNGLDDVEYIDEDLRACFEHSLFLVKNHEYEKCITYINQMIKTFDEKPRNKYYGYLQYLLAKCNIKLKNYSFVEHYLDNAIGILESNSESNMDNYFLADAYFYKVNMHFLKNDLDKCEQYIKKSMDALNKSYMTDVLLEVKLLFSLAMVLDEQNNYKESILVLNQIVDISKKNRYYYYLGDAYMLLGILHKQMKDFDKAIYYTQKSISFFHAVEEFDLKADCEKNLGNYYLLIGEFNNANLHLNNSLKYFESINDHLNTHTIKSDIQELLVKQGQYSEAIKYLEEIDMNELITADKARVHLNLGNSYLGMKNYIEAEKNLKKAADLLHGSSYFNVLQAIYDSFSNMHSELNDYQKAYICSQESKRYLKLYLDE